MTGAPDFGAAVEATQAGDVDALKALIDADPRLLAERMERPDFPPYFRDPKLFWFVANNPILVEAIAPNMVEVAEAMIARGVGQGDLDYALGLVVTGASCRAAGLQRPLIAVLLEAGAKTDARGIDMALAHRELDAVDALVASGYPVTAPVAAAFGLTHLLPDMLAADPSCCQSALAQAVINARPEAARLCLQAGADPNAFMPVHAHSRPLHQAALNGDLETMKVLVAHGACTDVRDTLWEGTPLGWARHAGQAAAAAWLEAL